MPHRSHYLRLLLCVAASGVLNAQPARAQSYTAMLTGPLGLNTVPSARMDEAGTVSAGVSTLDPYLHGYLGVQLADFLHINIRQSAEVSSLKEADRLYPGVDLKLRLLSENTWRPEITLGLQSALGHKRMAGEYLALSKRYNDFDFTLGMGWGRYGTAGHLGNPLKFISHFGNDRALEGEMPNEPNNWFTGEDIGIFGGVEYFTPLDGLSLKLDYGADRYEAEKAAFGYHAAAPWSAGLVYRPTSWMDVALAAQGTDKAMGRLSLHGLLQKFPKGDTRGQDKPTIPMRQYRTGLSVPGRMELAAENDDLTLYGTRSDTYVTTAFLDIDPAASAPRQIGRAITHMANHAGPVTEEFQITPTILGLRGPSVKLMRRDFEQALLRDQGSPQEIWNNAVFTSDPGEIVEADYNTFNNPAPLIQARAMLNNQISLAEDEIGLLYRSSLVGEIRRTNLFYKGLTVGTALRLNIKDNLKELDQFRGFDPHGARTNVDDFTVRRVELDRTWLALTHSFTPEIHMALTGGYLEEMYAGAGGEILYRPFGSRFALGAEAWHAIKRNPYDPITVGLTKDNVNTGFISAWYDVPGIDATLQAQAGRYLGEDWGGSLSLQKYFENGIRLEGFVTATNEADIDVLGGSTHAYNGLSLSVPLGAVFGAPYNASSVNMKVAPFGRDSGQSLDKPLPLYETTRPFSYEHMMQNWNDILED